LLNLQKSLVGSNQIFLIFPRYIRRPFVRPIGVARSVDLKIFQVKSNLKITLTRKGAPTSNSEPKVSVVVSVARSVEIKVI